MNSDRVGWYWSLTFLIPGIVIALMGVGLIPVDPDSLNIPRWMLVLIGAPFAWVGLYVLSLSVSALAWVQDYVALVVFTSFALIADFVAFGPGQREFESNVPLLASELPGRIVFGIGGILLTAISVVGWYRVVKYWITGEKDW